MIRKVGLCLGSGGAKGLAHIGVIKFLEEMNIKIDFITGSSIGALIGGAYAGGMSITEIENLALENDLTSTAKLFLPEFGKSGFVSMSKIEEFLITKIGEKNIEDFKIPFIAVATDIISGDEIHFSKGSLIEAIRASISIPIVFQPAVIKDKILVDGGLVNPVPINVTLQMGADYVIAVNVFSPKRKQDLKQVRKSTNKISFDKPLEAIQTLKQKLEDLIINHKWIRNFIKQKEKQDFPGMKKIFNQSVQITQERLIELSVELYKPNFLIEPEVSDFTIFDFYKAEEIIEIGYKSAQEILLKKENQ